MLISGSSVLYLTDCIGMWNIVLTKLELRFLGHLIHICLCGSNPRHSKFRHYTGNLRVRKGLWFYGRHGLYVLQFWSFNCDINGKITCYFTSFLCCLPVAVFRDRDNCSEDMLKEYLVCFCDVRIMFCSASMFVGYYSEFQLYGGFYFCFHLPLAVTGELCLKRSWQANLQIWSSFLFHFPEMSCLRTDVLL